MKEREKMTGRAFHSTFIIGIMAVFAINVCSGTASLSWTKRSDWIDVTTDVNPPAVPNDANDDTSAIQAALNMVGQSSSLPKVIYLPAGTYRISQTLQMSQLYGVSIIGHGRDTIIEWHGSQDGVMFFSDGLSRNRFVGLSWDGRNTAGIGYDHRSTTNFETRVRHEYESFKNFTIAGIDSGTGASTATAETMVWDCEFDNCAIGIRVGYGMFNYYDWYICRSNFIDCGTGIYSDNGKTIISECHFENSSTMDIYSGQVQQRIRRCTSKDSKLFVKYSSGSASTNSVIEGCTVSGWTDTTSAVRLGNRGPYTIFDCYFENPPNTNPPIKCDNWTSIGQRVIYSNISSPETTGIVTSTQTLNVLYEIPPGFKTFWRMDADRTFMNEGAISDGSNIIDVTQPPYNAVKNDSGDDTSAIQSAVNAAISANNGSIVYMPAGNYHISGTVTLTGGNYTLQGSGFYTKIYHDGQAAPAIQVTNPNNIKLEQFAISGDESIVKIKQSGGNAGSVVYDGVYCYPLNGANQTNSKGILFENLGSGMRVHLKHLDSPVEFDDCGRAIIIGDFLLQGSVSVKGADYAKSGFLGFDFLLTLLQGQDIYVGDNQDLAVANYYCEQSGHHLLAERGNGTGSGRITLQGIKQHSFEIDDVMTINNYNGDIAYFGQWFNSSFTHSIVHTGSNPLNLILAGNCFVNQSPSISIDSGATLIKLLNTVIDTGKTDVTDAMPTGSDELIAKSLDHIRELSSWIMDFRHDVQNLCVNGGFETDSVNTAPGIQCGVNPAGWTVNNETQSGGVRDASVVADSSTFSAGSKSMLLYDNISSGGSRLEVAQYVNEPASTSPAQFCFDVKVESITGMTGDFYVRTFAGSSLATTSLVYINMNNGKAYLRAKVNGSYTSLEELSLGVWYRIKIDIPAPSSSTLTTGLEVTNGNSFIKTNYTIDGKSTTISGGFRRILLNYLQLNAIGSIKVDNISLVTNSAQ